MAFTSNGGPFSTQILSAATDGASAPRPCQGYPHLAVTVEASAALSAGVLVVEEASYNPSQTVPYGGAWSVARTYNLASLFPSAGGQYTDHLPVAAYPNLRVRFTTPASGGTVGVTLEGC